MSCRIKKNQIRYHPTISSKDEAGRKQATESEITGRDMAGAVAGMYLYPSYLLVIA